MDYKKSKAPTNTVTRNIMDLCKDTGNIYESVAIIGKRANQISVEIKQDLSKKLAKCSRTVSRLKSHAITRSCQSQPSSLQRNSLTVRCISVTPLRKRTTNDTAQTNSLYPHRPDPESGLSVHAYCFVCY